MRIATIDLGTNTCHLLIAEIDGNNYQKIFGETNPVRLGEGGITKNYINNDATDRAVKIFKKYLEICKKFKVAKLYATATAAVRQANNKEDIITQILQTSRIKLNVINGESEASLIYEGVKIALPAKSKSALIMDIGGGSVEFIITNNNMVEWQKSFPTGAAFLLEKFNASDPLSKNEIIEINEYLSVAWKELIFKINEHLPSIFIGASGSFQTICDLYHEKLNSVDITHTLNKTDFEKISRYLLQSNRSDRLAMDGMKPMRVDMIVYAIIMITFVLNNSQYQNIHYSNYALKEGLCNLLILEPEHQLVSNLIFLNP